MEYLRCINPIPEWWDSLNLRCNGYVDYDYDRDCDEGDEGDECDDGKDGDHDEDKQWHVYGIGVASESTPQSPV